MSHRLVEPWDYMPAMKELYRGGLPGGLDQGACFTLNCAWLQANAQPIADAAGRIAALKSQLAKIGSDHLAYNQRNDGISKLSSSQVDIGTLRRRNLDTVFGAYGLVCNSFDSAGKTMGCEYTTDADAFAAYGALQGDVWAVIAKDLTTSGESKWLLECYMEPGGGQGHSISVVKGKPYRVFDPNFGEFEVSNLLQYFKWFDSDTAKDEWKGPKPRRCPYYWGQVDVYSFG